ncbi:MAG: STAS/SEC14 domain-containing protein [Hyphomonas sp.]
MTTITRVDENRLDIELGGRIDDVEMKRILDELLEKSEGMSHGQMLYTITDFKMPTVGAMAVEFSRLPRLFKLIGRFDRCAVVSDVNWVRTWSEVEGAFMPGLQIKAFEGDETVAAVAWLTKQQGS